MKTENIWIEKEIQARIMHLLIMRSFDFQNRLNFEFCDGGAQRIFESEVLDDLVDLKRSQILWHTRSFH